jgi:peptide/nickel transport system substrate-binding protein
VYWSKPSRRAFLRGAAIAAGGLGGAVLIGCGDDDDGDATATAAAGGGGGAAATATTGAASTTEAQDIPRGGTFSWAWQGTSHLDMHQDSISGAGQIVPAAYNRLLRYQDDAQLPEPDLAASLEQADELTITFHLNQGVKFHNKPPVDGREMTAEDVVYSLERARSPEPSFVHAGDLANVERIEAPDAQTVRITTRTPDAVLLTTLAGVQFFVLAREAVEQYGDLKSVEATIGTGAFIVESFAPDAGAKLVRNPEYWREGLPYVDELQQLDIGDEWSQFLGGKVDRALLSAEQIEGYSSFEEALEGLNVDGYITKGVSNSSAIAHFLNTQDPLFADPRVRWALNLLADRQPNLRYGWPVGAYPSIALGDGHAPFQLDPSEYEAMPGFRSDGREQDIADGLALLSQAGYDQDNPLKWEIMGWNVPQRWIGIDQLQLVAEMYADVSGGVLEPTVKGLEWGAWKQAEQQHSFQMISSMYSMGVDPHDALQKMYHSAGGRNFAQYNNPEFDAMLEREQGTFDIEERTELIREMLRYLNSEEQLANVWIGTGPIAGVMSPEVQGWTTLTDPGKIDRIYRV